MGKTASEVHGQGALDVLVAGEHPAAYLAAALVRLNTRIRVVHTTIPQERSPDRLVLINPELFSLHKVLEPLRRKLELTPTYGAHFLADDAATHSEFHSRSGMTMVGSYAQVRAAMTKLAAAQGVEFVSPRELRVLRLDEEGLEVSLGRQQIKPKVLLLAGELPVEQKKLLSVPDIWGRDIVHRYTFLRLKGTRWADLGTRPALPMSLDLRNMLAWAWLLPGPGQMQLAVEQPLETVGPIPPQDMLHYWIDVLRRHGVLKDGVELPPLSSAESIDMALAGALAHEGVANRTLLIGPAGGFYAASTEDIYPNCWSAVYAAEAVKRALREPHLQDALQPYRQRWRTTLGEYLRGPQQNLRFLLPLVYRNANMTARMAESILLGRSVVR